MAWAWWRELFPKKRRPATRNRLRVLSLEPLIDRLMLHDGDHDHIDTGRLDDDTQIAPVIEVEPNDTFGQSNAFITASDTLSGSLATSSDIDVYSATFAQGETVTLQSGTDPGQLHYSPTVELLDGASNVLARAADGSRIISTIPAAGTYYVRVIAQSQMAVYTGSYAVTVATAAYSGATETESNDSLATANALGSTSISFRGTLASSGDVDHFSFSGTSGRAVVIRPNNTATLNPALRLYDPSNNLLAQSLDGTGLSMLLPSTGTYRVAVASDNSSGTVTGQYVSSLTMSSSAPTMEIEPGNDFNSAVPWTLSTSTTRVAGRIANTSDVDLFAVDFVSGNSYTFALDTPSNNAMRQERVLGLFNEYGQILEYSVIGTLASNAATGFGFRIEHTGRHYIAVSARASTGVGGYVLSGSQSSTFPTQRDVPLYFHDYTAQSTHLGYGPVTTQIPAQYHALMIGMFEGQYDTYDIDVTTTLPTGGTTYLGFGAGEFGSIGAYGYGGSFSVGSRRPTGDSLLDDPGAGWTRFDSMRNAGSVMNQETGHASGLYAHARNPLAFMAYDDQSHFDVVGSYFPFPWTDSRVPDVESRNQREFFDWVLQAGRIATEVEPNNTTATAQNVTTFLNEMTADADARNNRVALAGRISSAADVDLYQLTVTAGQTFAFDVDSAEFQSTLDADLAVLDSGGAELATNQQAIDRESGLNSIDPYLTYTFTTAGTYYIRVRGELSTIGVYRFKATRSDAFDTAGPQVNTVWPNGSSSQDSTRQLIFWFNDKLDPASITSGNVIVQGATSGLRTGTATFDPIDSTLVWYADAAMPADTYTVTLVSGPAGIRDLRGNQLDGETGGSLVWPAVSGNDSPGGNFVTTFTITGADASAASISSSSYRRHPYNRGLFTLNWSDELDIRSVQTANWVLRGAGPDTVFSTSDDTFSPVDISYDKSKATNSRSMEVFTRGVPDVGNYRLETTIRDAAGNNVNVSRSLTVTSSTQVNGPSVVDVNVQPSSASSVPIPRVEVFFSGSMNVSTLNTTSFKVLYSPDPTFYDGNDSALVDANGLIAWDATTYKATFEPATPLGSGYYLIQLDGSLVTDAAGRQLDGEFLDANINGNTSLMVWGDAPSGDGMPGGDYRAPFTVFVVAGGGNHAPVIDTSGTPQFTNVPEDSTSNNGDAVSTLLGSTVFDSDASPLQGIAVVGLTNLADGQWQYSLDNGGNWTSLGNPSSSSARLLRSTDLVRFLPIANFEGMAQFQYRAWDQTTGAAGDVVDTAANGGSTAFSSSIENAVLRVTEVNDAPSAVNDSLAGVRDSSEVQTITFAELIANDSAGPVYEASQTLMIVSLTDVVGGTAVISGSNILFTPSIDYRGVASFRYVVRDDGTTAGSSNFLSATAQASFVTQDINDPPQAMTPPIDLAVVVNDGRQSLFFDAAFIRPGNDEGEWHQSVSVTLNSIPHPARGSLVRFGASNAIAAGESISLYDFQRLEYLATPNSAGGRDTISYTLVDNGTTNGAADSKSTSYSFAITADLASSAQVVRDINLRGADGVTTLTNVANLNGLALFFATDIYHGTELWRSDGTTAGTSLVRDIYVGQQGQVLNNIIVMGGIAYFTATDGVNGTELWRSDGTYQGTYLVKDIVPGANSAAINNLTEVNSVLFFSANDQVVGTELWRSDGTSAGTSRVADIQSGSSGSSPARLTNVNGTLFFQATTTAFGQEFWRSDGTSSGTMLISDFTVGTGSTLLSNSAKAGNLFYFTSTVAATGTELYVTNGVTVSLVRDINPGTSSSTPASFGEVNGVLYFSANGGSGQGGVELWRSDGTSSGTTLVHDHGSGNSYPASLINLNGVLLYAASSSPYGGELWRYDPTLNQAAVVADIVPGLSSSQPRQLTNVAGLAYFTATTSATGYELWTSNGTSAGTRLVIDLIPGANPTQQTNAFNTINAVGNRAFFATSDGVNGLEIGRSDGSASGTFIVRNVGSSGATSVVTQPTLFNNGLIFAANDGVVGAELWFSNGTSAGTNLLADVVSGPNGSNISQIATLAAWAYFNATATGAGTELWKTDGTSAGTMLVADTIPGLTSSSIVFLGATNNKLFFTNSTTAAGLELWVTDGTSTGTFLVKDINPGTGSSGINNALGIGNTLFFRATNGVNGPELWSSDGTSAGTAMIRDINPGTGGSYPTNLINLNGALVFYATNATIQNYELWTSNGTSSGTTVIAEVNASGSASPTSLTRVGDVIYFSATNGLLGQELWRTDGTSSGTSLVADIRSGSTSSSPVSLTNVNGRLFFTADDGVVGRELWTSNGTSAGTYLVRDISSSLSGTSAFTLTAVNDVLFFRSTTGPAANELWRSDGTSSGTQLVSDLFRGLPESYPSQLINLNGTLLFIANNGVTGNELYRFADNRPAASGFASANISPSTEGNIDLGGGFVDDITPDSLLTYRIVSNNNPGLFSSAIIQGSTLTLTTTATLGVATLTIEARDYLGQTITTTLDIVVIEANNAPVLNNSGSPQLSTLVEDPLVNPGTLITSMLATAGDPITDADANAMEGIAVIAVDSSNGSWEYSLNSVDWLSIGAVSATSARLLAADANTRVRFIPNPNYFGAMPTGLTFRAWDQTSGVSGDLANVSTNGGATAFSLATEVASLTILSFNDPPIQSLPASLVGNEDTVLAVTGISITDADAAGNSVRVTLSVGSGTLTLASNVPSGVVSGQITGNGGATVTITAPLAAINTTLVASGGLMFSPIAQSSGNVTLTVFTNDLGNTGINVTTDTDTVSIVIQAVNDGPSNSVVAAQYTSEDTTLSVTGISISDIDAAGADVRVTLQVGSGSLLVSSAAAGGVSAAQISGNGSATVTITAPLAAINATLIATQGLQFTPLSNFVGTALLTLTTDDLGNTGGGTLTAVDTISIAVVAVNDGPVNTVPSNLSVDEDSVVVISGISISDVDAGLANIRVTLSIASGSLNLATGVPGGVTGVNVSGNGSSSVTITAPLTAINATLVVAGGLTFSPLGNTSGALPLTIVTSDLGNSGSGGARSDTKTIAIDVIAVNDAPVNQLPAGPLAISTNLSTSIAGISITDVDAGGGDVSVVLAVAQGTLLVNTAVTGGLTASQVLNNASPSVTITAPLSVIQATLGAAGGLMYVNLLSGSDTLTVTTNDLGHAGTGGALVDVDTVAIVVSSVNQRPSNTLPPLINFNEDTATAMVGLSINDDAGPNPVQVTFSVLVGTLTFNTTGAISAGQVSGNGGQTVTVSASLDAINAALAAANGLVYLAPLNYHGSDSLTVATNDLGNTGVGGPLSDVDTASITIASVNDAPTLDNSGAPRLADLMQGEVNNSGTLVSAMLASAAGGNPIGDVDSGALRGIAITAADSTFGQWQFSTDGGANWSSIGSVSIASARLLSDDSLSRVRFVPAASYYTDLFDANPPAMIFRAWDRTSGAPGDLVDTTTSGGSTPFSLTTETAAIRVTSTTFSLEGTTLTARGGSGFDVIVFQQLSPTTAMVQINDAVQMFNSTQVTSVIVDGLAGDDLFYGLFNAGLSESFTFTPGGLNSSGGTAVTVSDMSTLVIYADPVDSQTFTGSSGDEVAYIYPNAAIVSQEASLTITVGIGTTIYNDTAGLDVAVVIDSAGDDVFTGRLNRSTLTGAGYSMDIVGFQQVYVFGSTGNDTADFFGETSDDVYYGLSSFSAMAGAGFFYEAIFFDTVRGNGGGGVDIGVFYDSAGNDTFQGRPARSVLSSVDYSTEVNSFDIVYALAFGGGNDSSDLFDSSGNDTLIADGNVATLFMPGALIQLYNFDTVNAHSAAGSDVVQRKTTDYLLTLDGPWILI